MEIIVLVIRDDELDMGDGKVASSEVAEEGGRVGKLWGCGSSFPGMRDKWSQKPP